MPDLSKLSPAARRQLQDAHSVIAAGEHRPPATDSDRALAVGTLGKLLMAAGFRQPAEACFMHAEALAPADAQWPYYLGQLHYRGGDAARAGTAFQRALSVRPTDVPSLIWLGRTRRDQGRADEAEQSFERARALQPRAAAALLGLGQIAVDRQQYARAIAYLEEALTVDPGAGDVRYALATAYRRNGDTDKAEAQLRARSRSKVQLPDPLMEEVDAILETSVAYEIRGGQALDRRDWPSAIAHFRRGIELAPDEPSLRHKLATALAMSGDATGALQQFEEVVRRWPGYAKGQYSLGVVLASSGRHHEAISRFSAAATSDPTDAQAHLQLGELRRALSRFADALVSYERAVGLDPRLPAAHFGRAMALAGSKQYAAALDRLEEATALYPDQPGFAHAAARLRAAAPVDALRNGQRALTLLRALGVERQSTVALAETMAMALAEMGRYDEAVRWQREAITKAQASGATGLMPRLTGNLKLYEQRTPCRMPWGDELRFATL